MGGRRRADAPLALLVILSVSFVVAACTTFPPPRVIRTPRQAEAYRAWDEACWRAGGPPTLDFSAVEESGKLYVVMSHAFGSSVSQEKFNAIETCIRERGVTYIYGFPPSMMGTKPQK